MRICFISTGKFTHINAYVDYFTQAKHDVHLITLSPGPERDIPTYNVGLGKKYSATEGKWKYMLSMWPARKLIKKIRPDIVHTHYATSGGLTGWFCGFHPTIVTAHGSDVICSMQSPVWRRLLKLIFNHADCINPVSKDLAEMVRTLGISSEKIKMQTLGIDTDLFAFVPKKEKFKKRPLKLVSTRRLELVYNHPNIIEALAIIHERGIDFRMTFVGSGDLLDELKAHASRKGIADHLRFLGRVDNNTLPSILQEHDIYLSSSFWDGTSLSLLEAMSVGVFPVVSHIKANSAWLKHGVDGMLHKPDDPGDLANCIISVSEAPEFMDQAIPRNRERVVELGSRKRNMEKLESIYQELITDGNEKNT